MSRDLGARRSSPSPRPRVQGRYDIEGTPPRKEDAACCIAKALPDGRLPIGFCGPDCIRRPEVWAEAVLDSLIPSRSAGAR